MQRDLVSNFKFFQVVNPQDLDSADITGTDVDTQGYESLAFAINIGYLSETNSVSYVQFIMQHADASTAGGAGTYAAVSATDVIGLASTVTALSGGIVKSLGYGNSGVSASLGSVVYAFGYKGTKRYVRMNVDCVGAAASAAAASDAAIGIVAILGLPGDWPIAANREQAVDANNV